MVGNDFFTIWWGGDFFSFFKNLYVRCMLPPVNFGRLITMEEHGFKEDRKILKSIQSFYENQFIPVEAQSMLLIFDPKSLVLFLKYGVQI